MCLFLILYPVSLLVYLWSHHALSTWLLAVSAFSVEVIVKVIVSLLIYSLFLIDAYRSTFWEKLDDYVYYIRAFGNTVSNLCLSMTFVLSVLIYFLDVWFFKNGEAIISLVEYNSCVLFYYPSVSSHVRLGKVAFLLLIFVKKTTNILASKVNFKIVSIINDSSELHE